MCLPVTGRPLLTELRRVGTGGGGFLTTVRRGLEKHAWWAHVRYFWVFQARRWGGRGAHRRGVVKRRALGNPSSQAVKGGEEKVDDLLAQRVGPCFTLPGHTAEGSTQTAGCLLWV